MDAFKNLILLLTTAAFGERAYCQSQVQKLLPADVGRDDYFGKSSAIDGDWAVVGMPDDDDVSEQSGAVYVYQRTGGNWALAQKLKSGDPDFGDYMGYCVAISGTTLVAGAPFDDAPGVPGAGAAYAFELVGSTWVQTTKLIASDPNWDDFFGHAVSATSSRIVVGSPQSPQLGNDAGAAYVFERGRSDWVETAKLLASDVNHQDSFGLSVSLVGDRVLVGAPNKEPVGDPPGDPFRGAAYLFEQGPSGWSEIQKFLAADGGADNHFGSSVALTSSLAIIGDSTHRHAPTLSGAFYVFSWNGSLWSQTQEIIPLEPGDHLAAWMVSSGDHVLVSNYADDDNGGDAGSGVLFDCSGPTVVFAGKFLAEDASSGNLLGLSVGISEDMVILGAPARDDACPGDGACNSGAAYIFHFVPTALQYGSCTYNAPCSNWDNHGGCRNSTGQGAILAANGSASILSDDLILEGTHLPPNKANLMFMGPAQQNPPAIVGDGHRVVAGAGGVGVYRFPFLYADAQGTMIRGPGLVAYSQGFPAPGRIQVGQTWCFQLWHRDPFGPCNGKTNFTNGVQVTLVP